MKLSFWAALAVIFLSITGCTKPGPGLNDAKRVVEFEFDKLTENVPGSSMVVKDWGDFAIACEPTAQSEVYACQVSGTVTAEGQAPGQDSKQASQAMKGTMTFRKQGDGYTVLGWEGA